MADCTFQPNVTERRKSTPRKKEDGTEAFYEDPNTSIVQRAESWVKRRDAGLKSKREEQNRREKEICTFKPAVHKVDKKALRGPVIGDKHQGLASPGYEDFIQRQVSARTQREELSKVPHTTGEGWTGKSTKAVGFSFHEKKRRDLTVKSLKKPAPFEDEPEPRHTPVRLKSESPGAVSSPEPEPESGNNYIPLHEIVSMQWYYVDKEKKQQGPMSVSALSSHWKDSLVHEHSYVWTQGMGEWVKAKDMPDLLLVLTHS